jgi:pimeloyl-ACP methyl ester carboxylesterase
LAIDETLLARASSFADRAAGFSERFLSLSVGGSSTVGVLASPLGERRDIGWVQCHSFGAEQADLAVMEAMAARRLASDGFPALRFHCQGYGDSEALDVRPGPSTHVRDTQDAVAAMAATGVAPETGLIGLRFGAAVAALVAGRLGLPYLVLIAPVVSGARYASELLWSVMGAASTVQPGTETRSVSVTDLKTELGTRGMIDAKGLALTREVFEEITGLDLLAGLSGFDGKALVVQVSSTSAPQAPIEALRRRLEDFGAAVKVATVAHREASRFGMWHMSTRERGVLRDAQADLYAEIVEIVSGWARALPDGGGRVPPG